MAKHATPDALPVGDIRDMADAIGDTDILDWDGHARRPWQCPAWAWSVLTPTDRDEYVMGDTLRMGDEGQTPLADTVITYRLGGDWPMTEEGHLEVIRSVLSGIEYARTNHTQAEGYQEAASLLYRLADLGAALAWQARRGWQG